MGEQVSSILSGTHAELFQFIGDCARARKVPMIWGPPGIGKTDVVHAWGVEEAERIGRKFVVWHKLPWPEKLKLYEDAEARKAVFIVYDNRAASNDSTDDKGIPNISNPEYLNWIQNLIYKIFEMPESRGIIFNDELTLAPTLVQNSMYKMVHDKAVGDVSFNEHILVICAGNRTEDRAFVQETPLPLKTRMIHFLLLRADDRPQIEYFMKVGVDHRLIAFFSAHPNLMFHYIENSEELTACTPRTIEFCSDLIADIKYNEDEARRIALLACGALSSYVGEMFIKFLKNTRALDVDLYLKDPSKAADLSDLEMKLGLVTLLAYRFGKPEVKKELFTKIMEVFRYIDTEVGILMLRMMRSKNGSRFKKFLKADPKAIRLVQDVAPIMLPEEVEKR